MEINIYLLRKHLNIETVSPGNQGNNSNEKKDNNRKYW